MNLLGVLIFRYPTFAAYVAAIDQARPAVNVGALVGHTALRNNHMDRLDRTATNERSRRCARNCNEALDGGALGLSTGLAYLVCKRRLHEEVLALENRWHPQVRSMPRICAARRRQFSMRCTRRSRSARVSHVPVIISHLKCAGIANWGRSDEVLQALDTARASSRRMRLLSVCGRLKHARFAAGR